MTTKVQYCQLLVFLDIFYFAIEVTSKIFRFFRQSPFFGLFHIFFEIAENMIFFVVILLYFLG